jgi:tetrahydromethanopterin S-methyltransferase subunit C
MVPSMVDELTPKMFNRITAPGIPEIGFMAEEVHDVSPFLSACGTDENGDQLLTSINDVGLISLLVVSLKDARNRIAALEAA